MPVHAEDLLVRLKVVEETAAIKRMKEQLAALGVESKKTGQGVDRSARNELSGACACRLTDEPQEGGARYCPGVRVRSDTSGARVQRVVTQPFRKQPPTSLPAP
jgi:hypothetical protein